MGMDKGRTNSSMIAAQIFEETKQRPLIKINSSLTAK